jgi:hypothetical protein
MRADWDRRSAYQANPFDSFLGVWPHAGFSGIAYRLAKLPVPRFGALTIVSALFYLI